MHVNVTGTRCAPCASCRSQVCRCVTATCGPQKRVLKLNACRASGRSQREQNSFLCQIPCDCCPIFMSCWLACIVLQISCGPATASALIAQSNSCVWGSQSWLGEQQQYIDSPFSSSRAVQCAVCHACIPCDRDTFAC